MDETDTTFAGIPEDRAAMAVMGETGDTKYTWDPKNPAEVEAAREHFDAMRKKGFMVFKLTKVCQRKGKKADEFNPKAPGYMYVAPEAVMARSFDPEASRYVAVPPVAGG
jgi:hypothetical protein